MDDLEMLTCETWEATDKELDKAVEKLTTDLAAYEKKIFRYYKKS